MTRTTTGALRAALLTLAVAAMAACDGGNAFTEPGISGPGGGFQDGSVQGTVTADGVGVGGIVVVLVNADSAVTDGLGRYVIASVPPRAYNVAIRVPLQYDLAAGEEAVRTVNVTDQGPTIVDWRLTAAETVIP